MGAIPARWFIGLGFCGHFVAADIVASVFYHGETWVEVAYGGENLNIHPFIICEGDDGDGSAFIAISHQDIAVVQLIHVGNEVALFVEAEADIVGGGVIGCQIQLEQVGGLLVGESIGGFTCFTATTKKQEAEEKGDEPFHYIFSGASKPKRSIHSSRARFARATRAI